MRPAQSSATPSVGAAAWRLTCSLATQAEAHGEAGLDPITQDSLTAPANDIFGFAGADLAVLPAPTQPLPVATDARGLTRTGRARRSPRRTTGRQSCLPCSTPARAAPSSGTIPAATPSASASASRAAATSSRRDRHGRTAGRPGGAGSGRAGSMRKAGSAPMRWRSRIRPVGLLPGSTSPNGKAEPAAPQGAAGLFAVSPSCFRRTASCRCDPDPRRGRGRSRPRAGTSRSRHHGRYPP